MPRQGCVTKKVVLLTWKVGRRRKSAPARPRKVKKLGGGKASKDWHRAQLERRGKTEESQRIDLGGPPSAHQGEKKGRSGRGGKGEEFCDIKKKGTDREAGPKAAWLEDKGKGD